MSFSKGLNPEIASENLFRGKIASNADSSAQVSSFASVSAQRI